MEFNLIEIVDWVLLKAKENGWFVASAIALIAWAVFGSKSFASFWTKFFKMFEGLYSFLTSFALLKQYKEAIEELKASLAEERASCDKQMTELRAIIEKQQEQIDELREKEMVFREELATLRERLGKHVSNTSRGKKTPVKKTTDNED